MALFSKKTKEKDTEKETSKKIEEKVSNNSGLGKDFSKIIKKPRITEKGAIVADRDNVYTFNVDKEATKIEIKKAIEKIYKVIPTKVAIAKIPSKKVRVRGQRSKNGVKGGGKKAYVYLKKGDKIEFV